MNNGRVGTICLLAVLAIGLLIGSCAGQGNATQASERIMPSSSDQASSASLAQDGYCEKCLKECSNQEYTDNGSEIIVFASGNGSNNLSKERIASILRQINKNRSTIQSPDGKQQLTQGTCCIEICEHHREWDDIIKRWWDWWDCEKFCWPC